MNSASGIPFVREIDVVCAFEYWIHCTNLFKQLLWATKNIPEYENQEVYKRETFSNLI